MITWSYGGGTQSVAIAVLIAQGRLPKPDLIGIADTGREASETWEYTDAYVRPLLAPLGLTIEVIPHSYATVDLYSHKGELLLPAFTANGKLDTYCSNEWKRRVVERWLRREKGVTDYTAWLGYSLDEVGRMRTGAHYPLIFDVPLRRFECVELVERAGLPTPPKSSCWMCPHRRNPQWARPKEHYPADWQKAIELDEAIRERDREHAVYLHDSRVPLRDADLTVPPEPEHPLFGQVDGCDSGMCWI